MFKSFEITIFLSYPEIFLTNVAPEIEFSTCMWNADDVLYFLMSALI